MSKHIHFFKAASRLGLINAPHGSTEANVGVETGPNAILSDSFLRQIQANYSLTHFLFTNPEDLQKKDFYTTLAQEYTSFIKQINECMHNGKLQVVVGGDHSVSYASVAALLTRFNESKTIGYIQFDSHADLHTVQTSPSGNFHGMWLRALLDTVNNKEIDAITKQKLDMHSVMYFGNLDTQKEEDDFILKNNIQIWNKDEILNNFEEAKQFLKSFITHFDHIHVSFDIDVFDQDFVTATGTPAHDGLDPSHVFPILEIIAKAPSISLDIVEVNPKKENPDIAIELAQQIIEAVYEV